MCLLGLDRKTKSNVYVMVNRFFDKVFLINLDDAKDRMESVRKECETAGIDFERISSVKGKDVAFLGEETEGWGKNALGLTLTTIGIIKRAKKEGLKRIFILEDDAKFSFNFKRASANFLTKVPENWGFISFNCFHLEDPEYVAHGVCRINRALCCQAYGISEAMYDSYIERLEMQSKPIDEHTADLHEELKNSYCPSCNIVYHVKNKYSTLREKVVNY